MSKKHKKMSPKNHVDQTKKQTQSKKRPYKTSLRRGSVAYNIFVEICEAISESTSMAWNDFLYNVPSQRALWGQSLREDTGLRRYRHELKRLRSRGYLRINKDGSVVLTNRGEMEKLRKTILKKQKPKQWDGKWRLIIFDIPEKRRNHRDFLRSQLEYLEFKELQQSVWITPYDVGHDIQKFMHLVKDNLRGDIRFARIDLLDEEKDLLRYFGLSEPIKK